MCRSTSEGARRCPCDAPEPRRVRQNLAYHMKKGTLEAEKAAPLQDTVEADSADLSTLSQEQLIAKARNDAQAYRDKIASFESDVRWLYDNEEINPETLTLHEHNRLAEIKELGSTIAALADRFAGISAEDARAQVQEALEKKNQAREADKKARHDKDAARNLFLNLRGGKEALALFDKASEAYQAASKNFSDASNAHFELRKDMQQRFSDAHRKAIAAVREVGEAPNVKHAHKQLREGFQNSISAVFPSDWVKKSNEASEILLKSSPHRAHYQFVLSATKKKRYLATGEKNKFEFPDGQGGPHPDDIRYKDWTYNEETQLWSGPLRFHDYPEKWRTGKDGNRVPVGRWTYGPVQTEYYDSAKKKWIYEVQDAWVRDVYHTDIETVTNQPVIRMNGYSTKEKVIASESTFDSVAVHEFSHRVESVNRRITTMENAFLRQRTTREDGTRDPLVSYMGKKDEVVREDSFVDVYMGKEYKGSSHTEILSMGSESLFCGTTGGLIGLGEDAESRADYEYRDFILGMYAAL